MTDPHPVLASVAGERTLKITTIGRKSGQPRTATIWFVVEGDHLFVQAGENARKGWLANVRSNPEVDLDIGGTKLNGRAGVVTDDQEAERILGLVRRKYWLARIAGWFGSGIGSGVPIRIELQGVGAR
jgi:deazaflavin-dependent oxidoreductase (nitroreductase family)